MTITETTYRDSRATWCGDDGDVAVPGHSEPRRALATALWLARIEAGARYRRPPWNPAQPEVRRVWVLPGEEDVLVDEGTPGAVPLTVVALQWAVAEQCADLDRCPGCNRASTSGVPRGWLGVLLRECASCGRRWETPVTLPGRAGGVSCGNDR